MPINILGSDLWSILLNGATPDSLTVTTNTANSALGDSGSNFTIEGWFYLNYANPPTALPTILISNYTDWNSGYNNRWALILVANTGYIGWMNHLGYLACQDTQTRFNQWVHIAVVRNGSTITLYINGTSIGTQTTNQNYSSSGTIKIAGNIPNTNNNLKGYISNLRIVKNAALYTTNFTPPTRPLTVIADTILLACQSSSVTKDNSSYDNTITTTGNPFTTKTTTPFQATNWTSSTLGQIAKDYRGIISSGLVLHLDAGAVESYSGSGTGWYDLSSRSVNGTLTNGPTYVSGSPNYINLDGVDDYIECSTNLGISGNVAATICCWFMATGGTSTTNYSLCGWGGTTVGDAFVITLNDTGKPYSVGVAFNGGNNNFSANNVYSLNTWYYIVAVKTPGAANTTSKIYLNTVEIPWSTTTSITPSFITSTNRIGSWVNPGYTVKAPVRVSNVHYYNRALSQTEITHNYNALRARYGL